MVMVFVRAMVDESSCRYQKSLLTICRVLLLSSFPLFCRVLLLTRKRK